MTNSSQTMVQHSLTGQHYGYSAVPLDNLGATEYTLVTLAIDESGSVSGFKTQMEECIKKAIGACKLHPRADYLMIRLISFSDDMREIHGFKLLSDIDLNQYNGCLSGGGMTLLFDTTVNALTAMKDYSKQLTESDFSVNCLLIVLTDGMDNRSRGGCPSVKKAVADIKKSEAMESLVTVVVGVNTAESDIQAYLDDFTKNADLGNYIDMANVDEKSFAKLCKFISQSISSQSNALGTGQASQKLQF